MNVTIVKTKKDKKRYIDFIYSIYKGDKNYSDLNINLVKTFLYKEDSYAKRVDIEPIIIEDNGIKLVGMFISSDDSKQLKLSFLEFLPNASKYIHKIIEYGKEILKRKELDEIIIGVNGQVSYGLGILEYNETLEDEEFEFNANYNPSYYTKELDEIISTSKNVYSFKCDAVNSLSFINTKLINHISKDYTFRYMDKKNFKEEMLIFGDICDKALKSTPYYSYKSSQEMYELMNQMKILLKNEDIIFALKDGKEVGLVFSHPDYAELVDKPKINYIKLFIRKFLKKPKRIIYNAIAVLPEFHKSGVAIGLVYNVLNLRKDNYTEGVTSFILEENIPSMSLFKKLSVGVNKKYKIYEIEKD